MTSSPGRIDIGRIDVHAHLLPAVDDGCTTYEDAIACARQFVAAGYSHACCTAHIWPSLPKNTVASIRTGVAELQKRLDEQKIPLSVFGGAEYNLLAMWPTIQSIPRDEIVTYGLRGEYVLFDFWAGYMGQFDRDPGPKLHAAIAHLKSQGFKPILAHPERIDALQREPRQIDRFIEMGVLLQMNTWCLAEPRKSAIFQTASRLMRERKYFMFGTDCHDPQSLPVRFEGVEIAIELFGQSVVDEMTITNPRKLLGL